MTATDCLNETSLFLYCRTQIGRALSRSVYGWPPAGGIRGVGPHENRFQEPANSTPAWEAGAQPISQRASCCLHRTFEHHPTAAYPHFPVPKIAALPRVHPPKLPMYSQSRAAA